MQALYSTQATATGGRDGHVATADGMLDLNVAPPAELGGAGGATNPEQLFAAGYAACFHSAVQLIAQRRRVDAEGSSVTAEVGLGQGEDKNLDLQVSLDVALPAASPEEARDVVTRAHRVCPYSRGTRGNVDVRLLVDGSPLEPVAAEA